MSTKLKISPVVREILSHDSEMAADEVIRIAKAKGLTAPDNKIRGAVHNIRSELRKGVTRNSSVGRPAKSEQTINQPVSRSEAPKESPLKESSYQGNLTSLSNIKLVSTTVGTCGGVEAVRQVVETIKQVGGPDALLEHLEVISTIKQS